MKYLDKIGLEYGTDKSSDFHDYLNKYEKYINFDRNDNIKILEIGIAEGKSLKMWKDYFINSTILGIDIRPECKNYEEERIFVEIGDQTNEHFLSEVSEKYGPFDLIIDDGSHMNYDVITTFNMMFKNLSNKDYSSITNCYSFPSGHTLAATFFSLYMLSKYPNEFIFNIIAILVGFSRIFLGVHYPSDIVGGMVFGFLIFKILV